MPAISAIIFGARHLTPELVQGKRVIDVGACDFNGSIRPLVESWNPSEYLGVDIIAGPCVDEVCSADDLLVKFGPNSFDIVLSIEMLEHSRFWKQSISNMKQICKPGGRLILTTRSLGYPCHGYPNDFWRFEVEDMKEIFSDFEIVEVQSDYQAPGVFVSAIKPLTFQEKDLSNFSTYSIVTNTPKLELEERDFKSSYFSRLGLKQLIKNKANSAFLWLGKQASSLLNL